MSVSYSNTSTVSIPVAQLLTSVIVNSYSPINKKVTSAVLAGSTTE